jgi:hypothetical protein
MNNINFSEKEKGASKMKVAHKKDSKKSPEDYKKEITELQKTLEKIQEKYEKNPSSRISSCILNIKSAIQEIEKDLKHGSL